LRRFGGFWPSLPGSLGQQFKSCNSRLTEGPCCYSACKIWAPIDS
jgi:hypothetical protein